ncbi:MAG: DUF3592 domain-containing protein [Gemmatimonadetes bacterium]|nr:MAG: DUF3592 domain-containing protein [Gemmatimonadota bacterium]
MPLVLILLSTLSLIGFGVTFALRRQPIPAAKWVWFGAIGVGLVGAGLVIHNSHRLEEAFTHQQWHHVTGQIVQTEIIDKSFRPILTYRYLVNGQSFTAQSDLDLPFFGGKRNRRETAEIIVHEYPAGKRVTVYYDPANPAKSTLTRVPAWDIFMKLSFGSFLYGTGLVYTLMFLWSQRSKRKTITP